MNNDSSSRKTGRLGLGGGARVLANVLLLQAQSMYYTGAMTNPVQTFRSEADRERTRRSTPRTSHGNGRLS